MPALEVGTKDYAGDVLSLKRAMSHMESLLGVHGRYRLGGPSSRLGWTFFGMDVGDELSDAIEKEFAGMMGRYPRGGRDEVLARFLADYLNARGCPVRVSVRG